MILMDDSFVAAFAKIYNYDLCFVKNMKKIGVYLYKQTMKGSLKPTNRNAIGQNSQLAGGKIRKSIRCV